MPTKPNSFCGKCRKVHRGDEQCPHRQAFGRKRDQQSKSGRGGHRWQKLRAAVFMRDRYLCQICKSNGTLTAVELHGPNHGICDHITPLADGGTDDWNNLQTICQACDKVKTQQESQINASPAP